MYLADCEAMLVTQSEHGMTLVVRGGEAIHVPALPVEVRDVSGAGDTVAAVLALTLAANADWEMALRMANGAGAGRGGTEGAAGAGGGGGGRERGAAGLTRPRSGGGKSCRMHRWPPRRRSCLPAAISIRICRSGAGRDCASASPMAASTSCIPATSGY